ncbi:hypothetical protein ABK040_007209 [Willaertia magna]
MSCPACEKPLSSRDIKQVDLDKSSTEEKTMCLCGFPPEVIFETANNAIRFWDSQRQVEIKYQEYLNKDTINKASQMERSYHEKLTESKSKIQNLSERLQTAEEQYEITKREFQNLQEKYSEKVRERNKLQELYNSLKRKYDQAYRDNISSRVTSPIDGISSNYKSSENNSNTLFRSNSNENFKISSSVRSKSPSSSNSSGTTSRSPLFNITNNNTSYSPRGLINSKGILGSDNNANTSKGGGFIFNRTDAHNLLYTPAKRNRPGSPRRMIGAQLNPVLPSRRSPSPK